MYRCPKCKSEKLFKLEISCLVDLFTDGNGDTVDIQYFDFEDAHFIICCECEYEAKPSEFTNHIFEHKEPEDHKIEDIEPYQYGSMKVPIYNE